MPYTLTWASNGLFRKFTGNVSGDEILKSNFELHVDPYFQDITYVINDFTEMTSHSIETSHTEVYAKTDDIVSNTKGRLKIALIVSQADHIELANSYCEQMEDKIFECEIFRTEKDARIWVSED